MDSWKQEDSVIEGYFSETFNLTEWENEPSVEDLKKDYESAYNTHDSHVSKIKTWLDNLNVTGGARIKKIKGRSTIVPKLIRKQAEWRYAALSEPFLSQEDLFKTAPVSWEDKKAAFQNGLVLNNQFNTKINKVDFIDSYIRTAVDEGTVIVRVGWDFEEEEQDVEVPLFQLQPVLDPQKVQQLSQEGKPPLEEIQIGTEVQKQMVTVKNQPTLEVCNYDDIIVDPTAQGDSTKVSFVIYRFETSLSDLEKAGRYVNLDKINIERASILAESDDYHTNPEVQNFTFSDKPRKRISAYEYWGFWDIDGTGKTKPIVATWVGDTMIRMEENPFPDKEIPFIFIQYLPVRFSMYGEPDGHLLEDNQKVAGAVTRGMIDIMGRSANGQVGVRQDALNVTNRRKFEMGMDYEYQAQIDPRTAFHMHTYAEIPKSAEFMLNLQNMEAESLTGVKAFTGGISGDSLGKTATGARGALDAASKRELGILRRLADGIVQIGRKIIAMNGVFLSEEEVIRLTNEEFVPIKRDDLAGKLDLRLDISTAETDNAKAQELAFMLQTMGNNMDPSMSQMILADIARLRKMPELAKRIEEFKPQPDPMQQQKVMLELELLKAQVAKEKTQAMENEAESVLDLAKAKTEEAKANQAKSTSDLQDLNFLEQESGIKQQREVEKQSTQAKSNMALKSHEADLREREDFLKSFLKQAETDQKPATNTGV